MQVKALPPAPASVHSRKPVLPVVPAWCRRAPGSGLNRMNPIIVPSTARPRAGWASTLARGCIALLGEARQARGKDWQPRGSTSEGDVRRKQHTETAPLSGAWEEWNGADDPAAACTGIARRLATTPARTP